MNRRSFREAVYKPTSRQGKTTEDHFAYRGEFLDSGANRIDRHLGGKLDRIAVEPVPMLGKAMAAIPFWNRDSLPR